MYYKTYTEKAYPKELIDFIKQNRENCIGFVYDLIKVIKKLYKIDTDFNVLYYKDKKAFGGGIYIDISKEFRFYDHISLITVLHEIRHALQCNSTTYIEEFKSNYELKEKDAREWSCSLYYICFPEEYLEKIEKGELIYV